MEGKMMVIKKATNAKAIQKCWKAMHELRPLQDQNMFVETIKRLQKNGYCLIYLEVNGEAVSVAGFETGVKLHRGRYLYIDDLSTLPETRNKGYGSMLLEWIFAFAKQHKIDQVHLDSGVQRFDAHRLYLKKGFIISSHHFSMILK